MKHRRTARVPAAPPSFQPAVEPATSSATQVSFDPISERDEIARLAYSYWEARGCEGGSPEEDWNRAEEEVRRRRLAQAR